MPEDLPRMGGVRRSGQAGFDSPGTGLAAGQPQPSRLEQLGGVHGRDAVNPSQVGETHPFAQMCGPDVRATGAAGRWGHGKTAISAGILASPERTSIQSDPISVDRNSRQPVLWGRGGEAGPSQVSRAGENTSRITVSSLPPRKKR